MDLIPPHAGDDPAARADAYAAAPLLNCLLREVAEPVTEPGAPHPSGLSGATAGAHDASGRSGSETGACGAPARSGPDAATDGASGPSAPDTRPLRTYRLPGTGRLLRVRGERRPADPEVFAAGYWHHIGHTELVKLVAEELRRHTGLLLPGK